MCNVDGSRDTSSGHRRINDLDTDYPDLQKSWLKSGLGGISVLARVWIIDYLFTIGFSSLAQRKTGALIMTLFYVLLPIFGLFCLWLGYRILQKAGFDGWWTLVLLVPIVNIVMIWVFAFSQWPNLRSNADQDL